jgi:hypothetical protein
MLFVGVLSSIGVGCISSINVSRNDFDRDTFETSTIRYTPAALAPRVLETLPLK